MGALCRCGPVALLDPSFCFATSLFAGRILADFKPKRFAAPVCLESVERCSAAPCGTLRSLHTVLGRGQYQRLDARPERFRTFRRHTGRRCHRHDLSGQCHACGVGNAGKRRIGTPHSFLAVDGRELHDSPDSSSPCMAFYCGLQKLCESA